MVGVEEGNTALEVSLQAVTKILGMIRNNNNTDHFIVRLRQEYAVFV